MPSTIRDTLSERIRALPGLARFLEDFQLIAGLPVHFVTSLGHRTLGPAACTLCRTLHAHPQGARQCTRFLQQLLESAQERPASAVCDAGLREVAVPLRLGGQTFGFLVYGHSRDRSASRADRNQARHLLTRAGVPVTAEQLDVLAADEPVVAPERMAALERLVVEKVERLVLEITQHIVRPPEAVPKLVARACQLVRAEYTAPLSLRDFARRLGVSAGHLSRIFHHGTGLRFVEYVARVRADHARALLRSTERPITDIAFACGFQSVSQFNRTMRSQFGCTPGELRQRPG